MNILLEKMTWQEVAERLKEGYDMVLIPTGAMEAHGPMLPLDTDTYICYEITRRAAEMVAQEVRPVVTPPIWFSFSWHLMDYPGTITLKEETFANVVAEVCESLIHHGFKKVVIVNGHLGASGALHVALYRLKRKTDAFVVLLDWWTLVEDVIKEIIEPPVHHADDLETSISLALRRDVRTEKMVDEVPQLPIPKYIKPGLAAGPKVHIPMRIGEWSKSGVWGYATKASKEKGEKIVKKAIERLADFLRQLKELRWKETLKNKYNYFL